MSVVAAAAAVGPGAAYGQPCGGGGGARKRKEVVQDQEAEAAAAAAGVVGEEEEARGGGDGAGAGGAAVRLLRWREPPHGLFVLETVREGDDEEEERSSIGAASGDEEDGEEVQSRRRGTAAAGGLACMDALDDALPIKRGLSSFFSGRSRSFANLQDAAAAVTSARDLAKPENPFNKRRRVLRCSSIRRVASTSLTALPPFLPPAGDDGVDDDGAAGSG